MSNVFGDAESNILGGTSNDDLINGYGGDDELSGGGGNDLLNGGADADTLKGGGGIDTLNGDAGVDNLKGGGGNDVLNGGADNDTLAGGKGSDTLDGGEGNDRYEVTAKDFGTTDTFDDSGTGGEDEIDADKVLQLMLGGDFNALDTGIESIRGDVEDELEIIGDGHAVNWDFTGIDLVNVSQILGSGENDVITGSEGDDKIKGGGGNDTLDGGEGEDNLTGGGGVDEIQGGDGDDKLKGGGQNDVMDGGEGSDTYIYKAGEGFGDDDIVDTGVTGTDVVDVSAGELVILAADVDMSGSGVEVILGNEDTGTVLRAGDYEVNWDFSSVTLDDIAELVGSEHGDSITGSEGDDKIAGLGGNDYIQGGGGNDIIKGNGDDDELIGNGGNDNLKGGGGDDTLSGGQGNDTLKGGGGNDTLVYSGDDALADGQDDTDTLLVQTEGSTTLDITGLAGVTLKNIEVVELGGGDITLVLDKASLQAMSDTSNILTVNGGAGDSIVTTGTVWTQVDNEGSYYVYTNGLNAILRVLEGVNRDGINTPADEAPHLDVDTGAQLDEGGTITITSDMLSASDIDSATSALVYKVTELPSHGSILVDGVALLVNGTFTQAQVDAGDVEYENAGDDGVLDGFSFTLSDAGNADVEAGGLSFVINATILGDNEGNEIFGGAGNDTLIGLGGDDILAGGDGDDVLDGDAGDDTLHGGYGSDLLLGHEDDDTLNGNDGADTLNGGADNDTLSGGAGNDLLQGGAGDDELSGGAGNDSLEGGDGDDFYEIDDEDDHVIELEAEGTDTVKLIIASLTSGAYTLAANVEDAVVIGGPTDFDVTGNDLDNVLDANSHSEGGENILDGKAGNDILYGGGGNDTLLGGVGNDTLLGGDDDDSLWGNDDEDNLIGGAGNDTLNGGANNDSLSGGAGNDMLVGGDGDDQYNIDDDDDTVVEAADEGTDLLKLDVAGLGYGGTYIMDDNVENATLLGNGDFNVIGNDLDNMIDAFIQSSGMNELDGAGGDDIIYGGGGNDTLSGGAGNDILSGNDELDGGAGEDYLWGHGGMDTLLGGSENDHLSGGADEDVMNGGDGVDELDGGDGSDVLNGGTGNDSLLGGYGDDTFLFNTALGANDDDIEDFNGAGETGGDVIQLDASIFAGLAAGELNAGNFVSAATAPAAADANDHILYAQDTGYLYYDADGVGGGAAVHFATLTTSPDGLAASDFSVIGGPE